MGFGTAQGGAVVRSEVIPVREAGHVADVDDRSGDVRAHPHQPGQAGPGHAAFLPRPSVIAGDRQVDPAEVRPEPSAPGHVRHVERTAVVQHGKPVPHSGGAGAAVSPRRLRVPVLAMGIGLWTLKRLSWCCCAGLGIWPGALPTRMNRDPSATAPAARSRLGDRHDGGGFGGSDRSRACGIAPPCRRVSAA